MSLNTCLVNSLYLTAITIPLRMSLFCTIFTFQQTDVTTIEDFLKLYFPTLSESPTLVPFYLEKPSVKNYVLLVAKLNQHLGNKEITWEA